MLNPYQSPVMEESAGPTDASPRIGFFAAILNGLFSGSLLGAVVGFAEMLGWAVAYWAVLSFRGESLGPEDFIVLCTAFVSFGAIYGLGVGLVIGAIGGVLFFLLYPQKTRLFQYVWLSTVAVANITICAVGVWEGATQQEEYGFLIVVSVIAAVGGALGGMFHARGLLYSAQPKND